MANRSFLVLNHSGNPSEEWSSEHVIVAASWIMPVLWFSLFRPDDRMTRTEQWIDDDADEDAEDVHYHDVGYPALLTRTKIAQQRAITGRHTFVTFFPERLARYYDQWVVLLSNLDAAYVMLDIGELWAMGAPDYFDRLLDSCSKTFAHQQRPDWVTLCEQSGMKMDAQSGAVVFEEEAIGHCLYGYWWERPVPWRQM